VCFNVFGCTKVEDTKYVTLDTDIICYSKTHVLWICLLSVPFIIIYVFGIPIFQLVNMCRYRKDLDNKKHLPYYGFLYKGLKQRYYYWELLEQAFKLIFIFLSKFLIDEARIQIVIAMTIISIRALLIHWLQPYWRYRINNISVLSSYAIFAWIYAGVFLKEISNNILAVIILIIIITINAYYIIGWIYLLILSFIDKC